MNAIVTILLLSLFSAYFTGFLTGSNMWESGFLSLDKLIKFAVFALAFLALLFQQRTFRIPRDVWQYILAGGFILMSLLVGHFAADYRDEFIAFQVEKELVRLAIVLAIFFLCVALCTESDDYRLFVYAIVIFGVLLAVFTIYHCLRGETEQKWHYIDGYLRGGSQTTDANYLGAILNIGSVAAIIGVLIGKGPLAKVFLLSTLMIAQAGRFATFSSGSLLSFIITIATATYLLWKYRANNFKPFLTIVLSVACIFGIVLCVTGLWRTVFYRVLLSDKTVTLSTIDSRLGQYDEYIEYIEKEPAKLVYGIGIVKAYTMSTGRQIHNSYLRSLAGGGIFAFGCFMFLWWRCLNDFMLSIKASQTNDVLQTVSVFFLAGFIGWSFQAATLPADTSTIQWFFFILAYILRHSALRYEYATETDSDISPWCLERN